MCTRAYIWIPILNTANGSLTLLNDVMRLVDWVFSKTIRKILDIKIKRN